MAVRLTDQQGVPFEKSARSINIRMKNERKAKYSGEEKVKEIPLVLCKEQDYKSLIE